MLKDAQTDNAAMTRNSHAGLQNLTQTNCVRAIQIRDVMDTCHSGQALAMNEFSGENQRYTSGDWQVPMILK